MSVKVDIFEWVCPKVTKILGLTEHIHTRSKATIVGVMKTIDLSYCINENSSTADGFTSVKVRLYHPNARFIWTHVWPGYIDADLHRVDRVIAAITLQAYRKCQK